MAWSMSSLLQGIIGEKKIDLKLNCPRMSTQVKILHAFSTRFDLRYIPDDMTFTTTATDSCTAAPDQSKYQPKIFQTTALQQQKVLRYNINSSIVINDIQSEIKCMLRWS